MMGILSKSLIRDLNVSMLGHCMAVLRIFKDNGVDEEWFVSKCGDISYNIWSLIV